MDFKRVLITGGWGLLGQHLVARLLDRWPDTRVRVLDMRRHPYPVHDLEGLDRVELVEGDITDAGSLAGKFGGSDLVVHLAGYISFWSGESDHLYEVNQVGTRNVVQAALAEGVQTFLHASSTAAVGFNDDPDRPVDEDFSCAWECYPDKHYMQSKHLSEVELQQHAGAMRWIIACPGLMLGPGDLNNSVALIDAVRLKRLPVNMPGGTNVIDVRDVADGIMVLLEKGEAGQRYLLSGYNLRFTEINRIIGQVVGVAPPRMKMPRILHRPLTFAAALVEKLRKKKPQVTSDNIDSAFRFRYFDNRKAKRLGWQPQIPFDQTVRDTLERRLALPES